MREVRTRNGVCPQWLSLLLTASCSCETGHQAYVSVGPIFISSRLTPSTNQSLPVSILIFHRTTSNVERDNREPTDGADPWPIKHATV